MPARGVIRAVALAALAAALVLVAARLGAAASRRYGGYLSGLWVGSEAFLRQARLRDFQLFLAPPPAGGGRRKGYLLVVDAGGGFVANQAIEFGEPASCGRWASALRASLRAGPDACVGRARVAFDAAGGPPPFPAELRFAASMHDGTLTLFDKEQVYAFLEKDVPASAVAAAAFGGAPGASGG